MTIIFSGNIKNKKRLLDKKYLRKYWDILYPDEYALKMVAKKKEINKK